MFQHGETHLVDGNLPNIFGKDEGIPLVILQVLLDAVFAVHLDGFEHDGSLHDGGFQGMIPPPGRTWLLHPRTA